MSCLIFQVVHHSEELFTVKKFVLMLNLDIKYSHNEFVNSESQSETMNLGIPYCNMDLSKTISAISSEETRFGKGIVITHLIDMSVMPLSVHTVLFLYICQIYHMLLYIEVAFEE